jgi:hypothetical protein
MEGMGAHDDASPGPRLLVFGANGRFGHLMLLTRRMGPPC